MPVKLVVTRHAAQRAEQRGLMDPASIGTRLRSLTSLELLPQGTTRVSDGNVRWVLLREGSTVKVITTYPHDSPDWGRQDHMGRKAAPGTGFNPMMDSHGKRRRRQR